MVKKVHVHLNHSRTGYHDCDHYHRCRYLELSHDILKDW